MGRQRFETAVSTKDISFVEIQENDGSQLYAGLLYYDMADLWVDIYSYSGAKGRSLPGCGIWYHSGKLDGMDSIMQLDASNLKTIRVEADLSTVEEAEYMLLNIPTGNIISNALNSPTGSVDIMPGFFDIFFSQEGL